MRFDREAERLRMMVDSAEAALIRAMNEAIQQEKTIIFLKLARIRDQINRMDPDLKASRR